jgi:hypothetical protein
MSERKYLPTLAELIDRLSIVQLKAIFIAENKDAYDAEMALIEHDIDLLMQEKDVVGWTLTAAQIRAVMVCMLANHTIWLNESKARLGGSDQDHLLKFTHSINGVRNTAKNIISRSAGERVDLKIDALAASLVPEFGNWNVFK